MGDEKQKHTLLPSLPPQTAQLSPRDALHGNGRCRPLRPLLQGENHRPSLLRGCQAFEVLALEQKYEQSRRMAYLGTVCEVIKTPWSWLSALLNSYKLFVATIG